MERELFPHFGFISLAKKTNSLGRQPLHRQDTLVTPGLESLLGDLLELVKHYCSTPNHVQCLTSARQYPTATQYIWRKQKKESKWGFLSAEDAPSQEKAEKQHSEPLPSLLCPQRLIASIFWTCLCWSKCQVSHLHLDLGFKNPITLMTAGSNTAGLSSETLGCVSPTLDQETHSQHFSASDLPLIRAFLLSCPLQSHRARTALLTHLGEAAELNLWCLGPPPYPLH